MSFINILLKGGWLMLPIFLASIVAVAIIIDRYIVIKKSGTNITELLGRVNEYLKSRDIRGAVEYCSTNKSPVANIIRRGLNKFHLGQERVKEAIENAGKQEVHKLEKGINLLATISGAAPLLGFLGTVTGMISAFMKIEDLQGAANPSDLAGGIWEALLTTAFGLAVGIIALTFYNYLVSLIKKQVLEMEIASNDVVDMIHEAMNSGKSNRDNS